MRATSIGFLLPATATIKAASKRTVGENRKCEGHSCLVPRKKKGDISRYPPKSSLLQDTNVLLNIIYYACKERGSSFDGMPTTFHPATPR